MSRAENINPLILTWARETAGLSIEDAARRIGLTSSAKDTDVEKLIAMEAGEKSPTRRQLMKIAESYRRPLTTFYRSEPPQMGDRGEDFRSGAGDVSREEIGRLDALLRDVKARQGMVRGILEDDEELRELPYVGAFSLDMTVANAVSDVRGILGLDTADPPGSKHASTSKLFADLRHRIENTGVFVLLIGDLGSHHSKIDLKVFRGFAIADSYAPFIVINDQDAEAARSFTLIHEFVHILLGSTGVSGAPSTVAATTRIDRVERFCNDIAGEILLPSESLPKTDKIENIDAAIEAIAEISTICKVSDPMVAYRFFRTKRINAGLYSELVAIYYARWSAFKKRRKEKAGDTGPSYYTVRKHRLGDALIGLVGRTLKGGELTHTKAAKVLGVKPSSVEPLLRTIPSLAGAIPVNGAN